MPGDRRNGQRRRRFLPQSRYSDTHGAEQPPARGRNGCRLHGNGLSLRSSLREPTSAYVDLERSVDPDQSSDRSHTDCYWDDPNCDWLDGDYRAIKRS